MEGAEKQMLEALETAAAALGYMRDGQYCYNCSTHRPLGESTPHKPRCLTRIMREAIEAGKQAGY